MKVKRSQNSKTTATESLFRLTTPFGCWYFWVVTLFWRGSCGWSRWRRGLFRWGRIFWRRRCPYGTGHYSKTQVQLPQRLSQNRHSLRKPVGQFHGFRVIPSIGGEHRFVSLKKHTIKQWVFPHSSQEWNSNRTSHAHMCSRRHRFDSSFSPILFYFSFLTIFLNLSSSLLNSLRAKNIYYTDLIKCLIPTNLKSVDLMNV